MTRKSKRIGRKLSLKKRGGGIITKVETVNRPASNQNLTLRLRNQNDESLDGDANPPNPNPVDVNSVYKDIKDELIRIQDYIFDNVESNFEYFSIQSYADNVSAILESCYDIGSRQSGGGNCNGEVLLSTTTDDVKKKEFGLLSSLKNFVEIKHDFKDSAKLHYEPEILATSRSIMSVLKKNKNIDPIIESLYDSIMEKYLSPSTTESEREQLYMKRMIDYMNNSCHVTNSLNVSKYISNSKEHGQNYISNKTNKEGFVFQTANENKSEMYYLSSIDNQPVEPIFSEDQVKFAFTDNSISDVIMYPHVHAIEYTGDTIPNIDEPLKDFKNVMQKGKISTIPSFMDPANTSKEFLSENLITDEVDKINAIRKRIQELQNLVDPYALPFMLELMKTLNDFFGYYGSLLKVKDIDLNEKDSLFYDECLSYIKTGIKNTKQFDESYLNTIKQKFPIALGDDNEKGFVFFDVIGKIMTGRNVYNTKLHLYIQDTTINTISTFMNKTNIFPQDISKKNNLTMNDLESMRQNFNKAELRIYNFAKAIYDNVPNKEEYRKDIKERDYTLKTVDIDVQIFLIILVSLKAFGDASQVNYSRRINDLLKNSKVKFPSGIGIRTTDKNVFAESILHHNPVWFMNNGIKPHVNWISKLAGDNSVDFDSHKVFITNNERGDESLYYKEIIKNLNRYKLFEKNILGGGDSPPGTPRRRSLDLSTPEIMNAQKIGDNDSPPGTPRRRSFDLSTPEIMNAQKMGNIDIVEKSDFQLNKDNLIELKNLMINVYTSRLLNNDKLESIFHIDGDSEDKLKTILFEANVFSSTMNDYMKNVEYLKNGQTQLQRLIGEFNESSLRIVRLLNSIANEAGGFKTRQPQLIKNIAEVKNLKEYLKVNKVYAGLKQWVRTNLNSSCVLKFNQSVISFNTKINDFHDKLPKAFTEEVIGRRTGRVRKTLFDMSTLNESDGMKKLLKWRDINKKNYDNFHEMVLLPFQELSREKGENKIDEIFNDELKRESSSSDIPFKTIIKSIRDELESMKEYEDYEDARVTDNVINDINQSTSKIKNDLKDINLPKWYKPKSKMNTVDESISSFLYGDDKYHIFDRFQKAFDASNTPNVKEKETINNDSQHFVDSLADSAQTISSQSLIPDESNLKSSNVPVSSQPTETVFQNINDKLDVEKDNDSDKLDTSNYSTNKKQKPRMLKELESDGKLPQQLSRRTKRSGGYRTRKIKKKQGDKKTTKRIKVKKTRKKKTQKKKSK